MMTNPLRFSPKVRANLRPRIARESPLPCGVRAPYKSFLTSTVRCATI